MADRMVVAHVLRRATFGPTAVEVDRAADRDLADVVSGLIRPAGADADAAALPSFAEDPLRSLTAQASREDRQRARQEARRQVDELTTGWMRRMATAQHQLIEKMVFFWHGHWATSSQKVRSASMMLGQLTTLRTRGMGDFAALARAMVRDPALIVWLDGQRNTRQAPNENLARELMELFTLGIGAYGEADIKQAARALTGWRIDRPTGSAVFAPGRHATGAKTILGTTADHDAASLVDLLVRQPAHAAFLAARLWHRFSSGEPLPDTTRARMVAAYGPNHDVSAMLAALLTDEAFLAARGQLVKQPVEWAVGAVRQLGIDVLGTDVEVLARMRGGLRAMGQVPLRPPSVAGWPSGPAWLTTSSLQARLRVAAALAGALPDRTTAVLATGDTDARLATLARLLAVDEWTDRTRRALTPAAERARRLVTLALASPEYAVS
jgi:uncharacterized protein (DUF1800 family)